MVKMDALIRHDPNTYRLLDYEASMHPIGAQLCGSKVQLAGPCAKIVEDLGFDVIDLNCGCPVDKVTKDGSGSGMLQTLDLIGEILHAMVSSVKIPVTIKIRAGWDSSHIVGPQITQIAEEAGASAICIHGRTRAQGYKGPANWDFIRDCKAASKHIPVIGNGDIITAQSAEKIFKHTGCDGVLLARGTMGKPWLIEDIYDYFEGREPKIRTGTEYRDVLLEHLDHIVSYQNQRRALLDLRRIGCWFLRGAKGMRHLRESLNRSQSATVIREMICSYPWHEADLSEEIKEEESCEASSC